MLFLLAFTVGFVLSLPIQAEIAIEADLYGTEGALSLGLPGLRKEMQWHIPWLAWTPKERKNKAKIKMRTIWRSVQYLLEKTTFYDLEIRPRIGTGDAAQTALLCGAANGIARALIAGFMYEVRPQDFAQAFVCEPCFDRDCLAVGISCIASVPLVHIIGAGLLIPINHWREKRNASH